MMVKLCDEALYLLITDLYPPAGLFWLKFPVRLCSVACEQIFNDMLKCFWWCKNPDLHAETAPRGRGVAVSGPCYQPSGRTTAAAHVTRILTFSPSLTALRPRCAPTCLDTPLQTSLHLNTHTRTHTHTSSTVTSAAGLSRKPFHFWFQTNRFLVEKGLWRPWTKEGVQRGPWPALWLREGLPVQAVKTSNRFWLNPLAFVSTASCCRRVKEIYLKPLRAILPPNLTPNLRAATSHIRWTCHIKVRITVVFGAVLCRHTPFVMLTMVPLAFSSVLQHATLVSVHL